ncbi:hypothetical protein AB4Z17_08490 [Paenibacillus sp. TAF43_2]|uniref:hypothetical protein n=1 Tax=Paenibacillus sp. TAF43_2 TaxID=3233069 RepID=UPI003F9D2144
MFKSGFSLTTDAHLLAAMFNKTPVVAYQDNEIIDYGGVIQQIHPNTIKINGMHYLKANCDFKIR